MDDLADRCLQRYRDGDVDAMAELVEIYRRPLFGFILKMTEGRGDAEEIFQEVWFRAIKRFSSFRKGNFLSWLFRITHNLIIDMARKNKRFVDVVADNDDSSGRLEEKLVDTEAGPGALVMDRDTGEHIRSAMKVLPPEQKAVFLMRVEAELTFKEIAKIQGVSINTALARMQYALERLRNELRDEYEVKGKVR
jgi:RNA polymerase sigma-70 factor (ECF subfamily)